MKAKDKAEMLRTISALKLHRDTCGLHNMTFSPCPSEAKAALELDQQKRFFFWWDSWILPKLEMLEGKLNDTD